MMLRPTAGILPAFSDESSIARAMFQFRSFQASSAVKGLMVAAQDVRAGQMAPVFLGMSASLGLGALSVYLSAQARGERAIKQMEEAEVGWWIDHAIERSGMLGWGGLITEDLASMMPGTVGAATRLDQSHLDPRARGSGFLSALGPSAATAEQLVKVGASIRPDKHGWQEKTTREALRLMTPNLSYLRRVPDLVQDAIHGGDGY